MLNRLDYDGVINEDGLVTYYFHTDDVNYSRQLFNQLTNKDVDDFCKNECSLSDYELTGATISIEINIEGMYVEYMCICPDVEKDDELLDVELCEIELDEETVNGLIHKVDDKDNVFIK